MANSMCPHVYPSGKSCGNHTMRGIDYCISHSGILADRCREAREEDKEKEDRRLLEVKETYERLLDEGRVSRPVKLPDSCPPASDQEPSEIEDSVLCWIEDLEARIEVLQEDRERQERDLSETVSLLESWVQPVTGQGSRR